MGLPKFSLVFYGIICTYQPIPVKFKYPATSEKTTTNYPLHPIKRATRSDILQGQALFRGVKQLLTEVYSNVKQF